MKAFALKGFDEPPAFLDLPDPEPGPGEVRVRVLATSVNQVDRMVRAGFFRQMQEYRFPAVFGRDVAGVVDRVGDGASRYAVGDPVFGFVKREHIGDGTFAEYVVVPEDHFIAPAPASLDPASAAVIGLAGVTALECVDAVTSGRDGCAGETVLVTAASGGVGTFAVQLAVARGAEVVATARTPEQVELVRSLGATHVVDWTAGDLVDAVRAVVPQGVSGFVDLAKRVDSAVLGEGEEAAHEEFARLARGVLRPGGRTASVTNGGQPELMGDIPFANVHSTPSPSSLTYLAQLVDQGRVAPAIQATYPFERIEEAFALLASGPALGKISVTLDDAVGPDVAPSQGDRQ